MSNALKKRLLKLRDKSDLDSHLAFAFVQFHDGKFQIKKQEYTPKFIEKHLLAEFDSEKEAREYTEKMDGVEIIFWDIFPSEVEEWENSHR
ncbi:hypothetical protein [Streptococcus jiangjianxini]|uniref:hypothetical protein n=1 Tax=Streptococcus jiangjianxini TaxID=3161189 RepID=UPI00386A5E35